MSDEVILKLLGIIEKLIDENERLRSGQVVAPRMPVVYPTYPTITTTYKSPVTHPSPTVTCDTEVGE